MEPETNTTEHETNAMEPETNPNEPKKKKGKLRRAFTIAAAAVCCLPLAACTHQSDVVSSNLSNAADNYQLNRQITFIDTITGQDMETVRGLCSLGNHDVYPEMTVTCKTGVNAQGQGEYVKDFFEVTPTTTVSVMQLGSAHVSSAHYSVTFNPGALVPNFNTSGAASSTSFQSKTPPSSSASVSASGKSKTPKTKVVVVPYTPPAPPSSGS